MAKMTAKVIQEGDSVESSRVELSNGKTTVKGKVATESHDEFLVSWEDGSRSVENKSDYELVVIAQENPAQPAGWAVAPVDANAYPGGELMAVEMQKRQDTAGWEDSQNRAPIDGENPAQPGGFAVPPASGQPIPGQGADGMVTAYVYASNPSGDDGLVEITSGKVSIAGKVLASDDDQLIVEWDDSRRTVESKSDYVLVVTSARGGYTLRLKDLGTDTPEIQAILNLLFSRRCNECGVRTEDGKCPSHPNAESTSVDIDDDSPISGIVVPNQEPSDEQ